MENFDITFRKSTDKEAANILKRTEAKLEGYDSITVAMVSVMDGKTLTGGGFILLAEMHNATYDYDRFIEILAYQFKCETSHAEIINEVMREYAEADGDMTHRFQISLRTCEKIDNFLENDWFLSPMKGSYDTQEKIEKFYEGYRESYFKDKESDISPRMFLFTVHRDIRNTIN